MIGLRTLEGVKGLAKREEVMMHIKPGTSSVYEFSLISNFNHLKKKGISIDGIKNKKVIQRFSIM